MDNINLLDQAFAEGFLKKQAEYGFEKEAFLPALLNLGLGIGGSVGGAMLGQHLAKKVAPGLASAAKSKLLTRATARNNGVKPAFKNLADVPVSGSSLGRGYDKVLSYLANRKNSFNLADQTGMAAGGILGGTAVTPLMMGEQ
jgi:hypothetical protein